MTQSQEYTACSETVSDNLWGIHRMVVVSQGTKPGRGIERLKCLVNVLLSSYASVVRNCDCVE